MRIKMKRFLGILLNLALVLGLMPGMGLTVYAAPTETLLTTITATGKEQANYSTANVATVSFSYTAGGSSAYFANWGWWGYGWSATVAPANGYTITKCVFYDDANRTATDSSSPFVVETTEEDKTPRVNGNPILAYTSKGITKIEVYGYATPAHTHSFSYAAGTGDSANTITATCTAGCPDSYDTNGISLIISAPSNLVCDDSAKAATLSGYPSTAPTGLAAAPTSISYNPGGTAPTTPGTYTASFTWGGATASVSFTLTANAYAVTLSGGVNATTSGGATTQSVTAGQAMTTVTYTATTGNHFAAFADITNNGITATRTSDTVVTVSGTPTANATITVPNATAVPTFTVTYIANNGTGETKVYTPAVGQTHNVEGQLFPAPQDKEFNNWLGDDGNTYLQGAQINTNRTLTAQWKDKSQGGGSHGGNGSGADIVFNIPGVGDGWEYIGGGVPQRAWRVSFAPMQGGSAYLALNTGETGETMNVYPQTTVWVRPTTAPGYRLASIVWSMIDGSASYDITQAQNFVMPAMDVVVYVTFQPVG